MQAPKPPQRELIPADTHLAICYCVCDIGTREITYQGKPPKMVRQILLQWELPNCRMDIEKENEKVSMARVTGRRYTFSCYHGAKLAQHITPWVGGCPDNFDFETLLGQACYLSIVHEKGKTNDNMYANIASVMKVPAGIDVPVLENPKIFYDLPTMKKDFPESMMGDNYKWLRELIEGSQEFADPNLDYVGDEPPPASDADVEVDTDGIPF